MKCPNCKRDKNIKEFPISTKGKTKGQRGKRCITCRDYINEKKRKYWDKSSGFTIDGKADRRLKENKVDLEYDGDDYIKMLEKEHKKQYEDLSYYPNTWNLGR